MFFFREDMCIKNENPSHENEQNTFSEHNYDNILKVGKPYKPIILYLHMGFPCGHLLERYKLNNIPAMDHMILWFSFLQYLSVCMGLCPRAYSDDELLLLLTVLGKVSLDTQLILHSSVELFPLQYKLINNIRDWEAMVCP